MKPSAIYSKSGKGVQEASGKTSLLKRGDRTVLSAIDGRATLGEVAQKVGKSFDAEFERLIAMLDKEGFVREVAAAASASASASSASRPAVSGRAPAAKPAAPAASSSSGGVDDLDFTSIMPSIKQPIRAPSPPKPAQPDATATQRAKEQEAALYKARQEAEARAQAERDRLRQQAEAKARTEAEAKLRAETEKKIREEADRKAREEADARAKAARLEAEAKANAAREAALRLAAEAKAKAEAEAKAKIEAERRAREEAERKAREEAEKARREAEELRQRLEEERKAREEAERRQKEEEERRRREEEERRVREEAERKAREEAERKLEEERRAREQAERKAREEEELRRKEEEARLAREAQIAREQQARELEEARSRARSRDLDEERARRAQKETQTRQPTLPSEPPPAPAVPFGGGSLDALMADLDSFSQREEEERRARDAAEGETRDERKRRAAEEAERRAAEEAARQAAAAQELERRRAAEEARHRQEEERRAQEEAERKREQERRAREAEEARRAEEEARKRREAAMGRKKPADTDIELGDADLGMDDVRRDQAAVARETRKAQRERERETRKRMQEAKSRAQAAAREAPVKHSKARRPVKWGRPLAITFFVALVASVGLLHVMPLPMADYEAAASEALGRPVRIGSAHLSLFTGVRLNLANITVGDNVRIAEAHAYPRIGSLFDERKAFRRIELDGVVVPQQSIGAAVAARLAGRNFEVERILASNVRLEGAVPLPALEAEARVAPDGTLRSLDLRGPESLDIKLSSGSNGEVEFDVTAHSLTVPFVPDLVLSSFAMKGSANRQGMKIASWGGAALGGVLSGSANVRWSSAWQVDGTMTARSINAAVFAPALLSEGKAEGSARFSMSGPDPAKLHQAARMEGNFSVGKGALGTFDLSRLLQTGGRQHGGRTQFTEMTGQARYERGFVALRNINISAGALTAGASADIAPGGALAGQIVADVRTSLQPLRATLVVGGTVKEPQVRN